MKINIKTQLWEQPKEKVYKTLSDLLEFVSIMVLGNTIMWIIKENTLLSIINGFIFLVLLLQRLSYLKWRKTQ